MDGNWASSRHQMSTFLLIFHRDTELRRVRCNSNHQGSNGTSSNHFECASNLAWAELKLRNTSWKAIAMVQMPGHRCGESARRYLCPGEVEVERRYPEVLIHAKGLSHEGRGALWIFGHMTAEA